MRIEINPRSLLNLENICEILYKLHPTVLDYLVGMLGRVLGMIDLDNPSMEEREFIANNYEKKDYSLPMEEDQPLKEEQKQEEEEDDPFEQFIKFIHSDDEFSLEDRFRFKSLLKYLQLDTYEYIPIKINIEVEDPVIGKKVKKLVRALEATRCPEQFYLNKREIDYDAYFSEGYNLTMNKEQEKRKDEIFDNHDFKTLKKILRKEKLYP